MLAIGSTPRVACSDPSCRPWSGRWSRSATTSPTFYRSVGLRGSEIAAVATEADGLDDRIGTNTAVVDASDLTLHRAFVDSHEHLMEAGRNTLLVPVPLLGHSLHRYQLTIGFLPVPTCQPGNHPGEQRFLLSGPARR
jgi:hypothetical protein